MERIDIYNTPSYWPYILLFFHTWKFLGYGTVMYLAAITAIDTEMYEAAEIDGANVFQRIMKVTVPNLAPTFIILMLLAVGNIFRGDFGMFYNMVGSNGMLFSATDVIDTFVFRLLMDTNRDISEHTIRICMQDAFVDSPSREQQQWMGDGRWQGIYQTYYSGDGRLHRKLLEQIGQSQDWQGMTAQRYPDGHHNYPPIPSFCLHWVSSFGEYVSAYGDDGLLAEWWPNIVQALRWFSGFENKEGLLENLPYWAYVDAGEAPIGRWPDVARGGIVTSLNLLYLEAMQNALAYAALLEDQEAAGYYRQACSRLADGIRNKLWNPEENAYTECLVDGIPSSLVSESANALALLVLHDAGDERSDAIYRSVFAPEAAGKGIKASPFFMMVVYRALMKAKREDRMLELVQERYGRMLDAGATSVWEWWDLFYRDEHSDEISFSSACHAWGSMPVMLFLHSIVGIQPVEANNRLVRIKPRLMGDLTWAEGSIPTASGPLVVRVERQSVLSEAGAITLTVPEGVTALCGDLSYGTGKHEVLHWKFD